ncbi:conjugation system SOS inhibitor PsiB family protein [Serratia ureilytica]|uniref:conjugation system SOS inhibitor PsiB family protein n=1 Tax=Serratia ureilytica TaxID=300181 RepID=UPI001B8FCBEB|nr:conjugation system SOS inhibitor PsiB family protein [Serratia ureilytica]HBC5194975.1 hypothetical protein [Serratia marcescens]
MKNAFNLETLTTMSADELEQYRDRGREYRVMLNCTVLGQLAVPARFPCLAELDRYLWASMPFWKARLQVSLISAELSAEAHIDNAARLPNRLLRL